MFSAQKLTSPQFHPNFWDVPVEPDCPCWGQPRSRGLMLFGRKIIFEEFQPMWSRYLTERHTRTDRRTTDGRTIYDRNTALCTKVHRAVKTATVHRKVGLLSFVNAVCFVQTSSMKDRKNVRSESVSVVTVGLNCCINSKKHVKHIAPWKRT